MKYRRLTIAAGVLSLGGCSCSPETVENAAAGVTETGAHVAIGGANAVGRVVSDKDNQRRVGNAAEKVTEGGIDMTVAVGRGVIRGARNAYDRHREESVLGNEAAPQEP